jgi:hypothetical protein
VKLRGKWVQIDPREWKNKFNMTVTVGLGTGSQQTVINGVNMLGQLFAGATQLGFRGIQEQNIYHLLRKAAKAVFPRDVDMLVTDPSTLPPPQPKPDPEMLKIQLAAHKAELGDAQKRDKMGIDAQLENLRREQEAQLAQLKVMFDAAMKEKDHQADAAKQVMEMANQQRQLMMEKLSELRLSQDENVAEKENKILEGKIQSLLDAQQQQQDLMHKMIDAQMAERENEVTERDQKGKVKKTVSRVKK